MEQMLKAKEGTREEQISRFQKQIKVYKANLLKFDKQRFDTKILDADSYKRLKGHTLDEITNNKLKIDELERTDTAFEKYCSFGMNILTHLSHYFDKASLEVKQKILGSIFPLKLTYEDGKCRTEAMNPAISIMLQKTRTLGKEKPENSIISEEVSGCMPTVGQLSNHFIDGMTKIYELEPFISVEAVDENRWGLVHRERLERSYRREMEVLDSAFPSMGVIKQLLGGGILKGGVWKMFITVFFIPLQRAPKNQ